MIEYELSRAFDMFLSAFAPFAVFLAIFSFVYAALGRSKLFHFERIPRLILSIVLALYSANAVLAGGWSQILTLTATAVTIGLGALIVYHVGFQRGKTKHESLEVVEEEDDEGIREFLKRRNW